jgi:hypothetical protein
MDSRELKRELWGGPVSLLQTWIMLAAPFHYGDGAGSFVTLDRPNIDWRMSVTMSKVCSAKIGPLTMAIDHGMVEVESTVGG